MDVPSGLKATLAVAMIAYVVAMYLIGYWSSRRIETPEDYLVAGRRLPLSLAWMTLLATWFGAGTILTAADEVRREGLRASALDPLGAGCCLLLAGLVAAGPLWRMKLLTVPDFFRVKFGPRAELLASLVLVPSYFGWIAAQFTALAHVLDLFFGIPVAWGLLLVAVVGTGYTLMGGMWSVTWTDAIQVSLVLSGLVVLAVVVFAQLGSGDPLQGAARLASETPRDQWTVIPLDSWKETMAWLGVFAVGALGNLPGQDLMQRVFAAKSERVARRACLLAGSLYLVFGAVPLVLALAGGVLFPERTEEHVLPVLAAAFLHPAVAIVFLVAVLSAILSTIDSAILSPASVLAQNVAPRWSSMDRLRASRYSVLLVAGASYVVACLGESAYALLEESYALTLTGLVVPLLIGLYSRRCSERAAIAAITTGGLLWAIHFALDWEVFLQGAPVFYELGLPASLTATMVALLAYVIAGRRHRSESES